VSTDPRASDRPRDYVPLALIGLAAGVTAGTALTVTAFWAVRSLQGDATASPGATPELNSPTTWVFLVGSLGGVLTAAAVTWTLLSPIGSTYRQGGMSLVASFATIVVATVVAFPMETIAGRWGLLGAGLVAAVAAWRLARAARRAAETA